ncbi:MAG TPA: hypothetical protein VHG35_17105 [Gemmatimonadales bacterium]|nr:hypothetical protein [Gemmatimonadales bacterium]
MATEPGSPETLEEVKEYIRTKLAPVRHDPGARDHWFDDVKDGFDTLWCAVARLELMAHCGMSSKDVGGPVLVDCKNTDEIALSLRQKCPSLGDQSVLVFFVKKPPPGSTPWE